MLPEVRLAGQRDAADGDRLSRNQAASLLGISLATMDKLLRSGYLPRLAASSVFSLAATPYVTCITGVLPVLRTAAATPSDDGREFIGDATFLTDAQFVEANAGWWRSDPDTITGAGILPVSIASFITGALRIHGVAKSEQRGPREVRHFYEATVVGRVGILGDRNTYRITTNEPEVAELTRKLLGSRVRTVSGGPIAYLTPDAES